MSGRSLQVQVWRVIVWARICWLLSFVVGYTRAERWARFGANRLVRFRKVGYFTWHRVWCRDRGGYHEGKCKR